MVWIASPDEVIGGAPHKKHPPPTYTWAQESSDIHRRQLLGFRHWLPTAASLGRVVFSSIFRLGDLHSIHLLIKNSGWVASRLISAGDEKIRDERCAEDRLGSATDVYQPEARNRPPEGRAPTWACWAGVHDLATEAESCPLISIVTLHGLLSANP